MSSAEDLVMRIRRRILTDLNLGEVDPGDRLPSIRVLAEELDVDHRAVASAYRALEEEGLVDIRPRSGVYVASRSRLGEGVVLSSTARWVSRVLVQGLSRRIPVPDLPEILRQCTSSLELRCLCVESVQDVLDALVYEVEKDLGLHTSDLLVHDEPTDEDGEKLRRAVEDVDVVVTTVFHGAMIREVVGEPDLPVVEVRVNSDWVASFRRSLRQGPVTVVVKDPDFGERLRAALEAGSEGLRIVGVPEARESLEDPPSGDTLFVTPSARRELDRADYQGIHENVPMLSHATLRRLVEVVVRRNVEVGACP